jgi:TPR repeat protein
VDARLTRKRRSRRRGAGRVGRGFRSRRNAAWPRRRAVGLSRDTGLDPVPRSSSPAGRDIAELGFFAPKAIVAAVEPPVPKTREWLDPRQRAAPTSFGGATKIQPSPDQQTPAAEQTTPAPTRVAPAQRAVLDFVTRHLDSDELASLLQRADDLIKSRDISSARLLLRRAAEAGDVRATITLAGTFDPNALKALGFQDGAADVAQARLWYERAEKSGSTEALGRLQQLATTSVR